MKSLIRALLVVLVIVSWSTPAWVGTWTANEFVYKPSVGSRGTAEKNLFDAALNRLDARLAKETWVGDPLYGATIQTAVTALGSTAATLRVPYGPWTIPSNFTIPANITLKPNRGAVLNIADGATLTLNSFEAGPYRTFTCTGTGKVVFGAGAVREVRFDWWGPAADGATNDSAKLQAAIDSLATCKGVVKVAGKSYALANTVLGRFGVTVEGIPETTTFVMTGTVPAFGQAEDFYNNTIRTGYWTPFKNFNIDASANAHDLDLMYFDRHFTDCSLLNVNFYGNPAQTQTGVHLYHSNPDTGVGNFMYHDVLSGLNFYNVKSPDGCIFLEGCGDLVRRANNVVVQYSKFTNYKVGTKIGGIGNRVQNCCYNRPDNPVLTDNTGGTDFRAIFYDGYNNIFANNWLEGGAGQVIALMYGQGTGSASAVCDFPISSVGLITPNQIADLAVATPASYGNVAAYSAANTLVVAGADVHATYPAGRQVWVDCGADGWRTSTVSTATYSAPNTTIVLTTSVLTSNLATISAGSSYGLRSGLSTGSDLYYENMRPSRLYTGNGATHYLSAAIKGSTTYNFSATPLTVNAGSVATLSLSAPGALVNQAAHVNTSTTLPTGIVMVNWKPNTDVIVITFYNPTAGNITINTSQIFKWVVFDGV